MTIPKYGPDVHEKESESSSLSLRMNAATSCGRPCGGLWDKNTYTPSYLAVPGRGCEAGFPNQIMVVPAPGESVEVLFLIPSPKGAVFSIRSEKLSAVDITLLRLHCK